MRRNNFALRLQPSLLDELRKAAELEGVAVNQLINVAVAEKVSALRTEEYLRERGRRADRAETLRILERAGRGNPLWKAMNFQWSGRRSQAGKLRMGEIRSASEGKRKRPRLSSSTTANPSPKASGVRHQNRKQNQIPSEISDRRKARIFGGFHEESIFRGDHEHSFGENRHRRNSRARRRA